MKSKQVAALLLATACVTSNMPQSVLASDTVENVIVAIACCM